MATPVEGDVPVVYYTPSSTAFFTSLPPLLSLVFGATSLVLVLMIAFAGARFRRRKYDLYEKLMDEGGVTEGVLSSAKATCLSTNTTVLTSHLETKCQILALKKKETYRTWYLWQKNAPMWMVDRVKEERMEDGGYGDSRRRDHWIVEWVDEGPPVIATSPLTLSVVDSGTNTTKLKTIHPPTPTLNTISLSSLPHHPVLSTFASTNVSTGIQEAVGYTNSKEQRGAKVGDRRWCFRTGYMKGEKLAVVGFGGDRLASKKVLPSTPVFRFESPGKGGANDESEFNEDAVNETTPLSISMDIEYGGRSKMSIQEEIVEALNSPLKFTGDEEGWRRDDEDADAAAANDDDDSVIKGVPVRGGEDVIVIERYEGNEEGVKEKVDIVKRFVSEEGKCKVFLKSVLLVAWAIAGAGCCVGVIMQAINEKETFPKWLEGVVLNSPEMTTIFIGLSAWVLGRSLGWGGYSGFVGVLAVVGICFGAVIGGWRIV